MEAQRGGGMRLRDRGVRRKEEPATMARHEDGEDETTYTEQHVKRIERDEEGKRRERKRRADHNGETRTT